MIVILVGAACMCPTIAVHDICMNSFTNICLSSCVCVRNHVLMNYECKFDIRGIVFG